MWVKLGSSEPLHYKLFSLKNHKNMKPRTKKKEVRVILRLRLITQVEIQAGLISGGRESDQGHQKEGKWYAIQLKWEEGMAMCLVMLAGGVNTTQNPQFQVGGWGSWIRWPQALQQWYPASEMHQKKPESKKIDGDANERKRASHLCIPGDVD